jgi:carbonic anhydrase
VRLLKDARGKSAALKEIIAGNEQFKKQNQSQAAAFKQAHQNQSPQTRQLVAAIKT